MAIVHRVQSPVTVYKKSNRWIITLFLGIAVLAFLGFSLVPIFGALLNNSSTPTANELAGETPPDSQYKRLQDEANGYELVLAREPENPTALRGLVEARLQLISVGLSDVEELIDPLEKLAQLNPEQTQYTVLLAQVQQQAGDPEAAAASYRSVLTTQPGNLEALQGYVALLLQQDRPTYAIEVLQTTLDTAPQANQLQPGSVNESAVQLLMGQVYVAQQNFDQATDLYDRLIAENPQDFRPVFAKAVVRREQGQSQEAQTLFDQAASLAPAEYKDQIEATAQQPAPTTTPDASPEAPSE